MNAREAKAAGFVWLTTSFSGGKTTPLLGACSIKTSGPKDPDRAFLIFKLVQGLTIEEAVAALHEAKAKALLTVRETNATAKARPKKAKPA